MHMIEVFGAVGFVIMMTIVYIVQIGRTFGKLDQTVKNNTQATSDLTDTVAKLTESVNASHLNHEVRIVKLESWQESHDAPRRG